MALSEWGNVERGPVTFAWGTDIPDGRKASLYIGPLTLSVTNEPNSWRRPHYMRLHVSLAANRWSGYHRIEFIRSSGRLT